MRAQQLIGLHLWGRLPFTSYRGVSQVDFRPCGETDSKGGPRDFQKINFQNVQVRRRILKLYLLAVSS